VIETLHDDEWVSLRRIVARELGIHGYVYSHETRCAGRIAVVMPFRMRETGLLVDDDVPEVVLEVLLREEVTPCWHTTEPQLSGITGGWEDGDDLGCLFTAIRELWEEAGYRVHPKDMVDLGTCRGTKSTDTVYFLWGVDLTDVEKTGDGSGDGSELEARATNRWVLHTDVIEAVDPTAHVARNRLMAWLVREFAGDDES
jgi:8-oxo-dGTP pyrophosphatase MutT (NUDIX family)